MTPDTAHEANLYQANEELAKTGADRVLPSSRKGGFRVIGIGASAGGLSALEQFFNAIPANPGMSFVVVTHLSPDYESALDAILARKTFLPVTLVEDGMEVEPNHVYVIPAGKEMIISAGRLLLTDTDRSERMVLPINTFLCSLARDFGERAAAVILSGSGSDGSRGAKAVHDAGGMVVVQDPESASFGSMPQSALGNSVADAIVRPAEIPQVLLEGPVRTPPSGFSQFDSKQQQRIDDLLELLQSRHGVDFTNYKMGTIVRRLARRAQLASQELPSYLNSLLQDEHEQQVFYQDLLVNVTSFFRDESAFAALEQIVIPKLLDDLGDRREIRIWVAACSSGEEAYTIAMLLDEQLQDRNLIADVKIFATDVDRQALEMAGAGQYTSEQVAGVSEQRLQQYFEDTADGTYRVNAELRRMLVFAKHDVLRDAPFTKLDLVSCRNLLIYLEPQAQQKALSLFHFGLRPKGYLMLGSSETVGDLHKEFATTDGWACLFQKQRDVSLLNRMRLSNPSPRSDSDVLKNRQVRRGQQLADQQIIAAFEQLASVHFPPSFFINESFELVYSTPGANEYLAAAEGRFKNNILEMVVPDLRTVLNGALRRAMREDRTVAMHGVTLGVGTQKRLVNVRVSPQQANLIEGTIYVASIEAHEELPDVVDQVESNLASPGEIERMQSELRLARESLQSTIQELETSNEELQNTNEELTASNEELQSTNEELHSVNEELYTVNVEHQRKIGELSLLSEDVENLLQSVDVATMFLSEVLEIRKFTPGINNVFQVNEGDVGRSIESFNHTLDYPELYDDLRLVVENHSAIEKEVHSEAGTRYLVRVLPYLSSSTQDGVILSLIDLTMLESERQKLRASELRFRSTFENAAVGIAHVAVDGRWLRVNDRLCKIVEYSKEELLATDFQHITHPKDLDADLEKYRTLVTGQISSYTIQKRYIKKSGKPIWINLTVSMQRDDEGKPLYAIAFVQDISKRKQFEAQLKSSIVGRDRFLATLSHELRNPLAAVLSAIRVIERRAEDGKLNRQEEVILRQSEQISRLLDDLLDVARITKNKLTLDRQRLDLNDLARSATQAIDAQRKEAGLDLSLAVPTKAVWVDVDRTRLLQVLENLLSNAVKYTPAKGKIRVIVQRDTHDAVLTVVDSGRGIEPDLMPLVFDMFVQADPNHKQVLGGLGVGLTLVKSLIEMHGGKVDVESDGLGHGSRFTVRLPLAEQASQLTPRPGTETAPIAPCRVLVIEDQPDAREMMVDLLELDGHEVTSAADGNQGLEAILAQRPDVALVDIHLPGLDGYQVARQVRSTIDSDSVYLVALTGFGGEKAHQEIMDAGFDEHLVKPVKPGDLSRVLAGRSGIQSRE